MPKPDLCEIIVVLDRSGSMAAIKDDMEGGFDKYIESLKSLPQECRLTLVQFDHEGIETVHESKPVAQVPPLVLSPRGMTPLLDAVGKTIHETGNRFENTPEDARPGKVLFVIITDGQENASREFTREAVKNMVEHQAQKYQWQFVYLGANVDAFLEAGAIGIAAGDAASFAANRQGLVAMVDVLAAGTREYMGGKGYRMGDADRERMMQKSDKKKE